MDLFVYGTLRDLDLMATVAGPGPLNQTDAMLQGFRVKPLKDDVVPLIVPDVGVTKGVVWSGLKKDQIQRLDAYEGAFGYQLAPVDVVANGETQTVQIYMPPDTAQPGQGEWFLHDWQRRYRKASILAAEEIFANRPTPDAGEILRMWHTVQMRAWARVRAAAEAEVADHRFQPSPDDWAVIERGALKGEFFRLQAIDVEHRLFDGTPSGPLRREVFLGVDAVVVLPYDPVLDKVLLVEQARMGPLMRGDPNPWVLEPVAGMIDARETPQEAAIRETAEETGITQISLEKISAIYPSPGSSTDHFTTYVGLCDLPQTTPFMGGVADEDEDLRLHPISFDAAIRLVETGEINAGPLVMMMYWLALNRDRLRNATS